MHVESVKTSAPSTANQPLNPAKPRNTPSNVSSPQLDSEPAPAWDVSIAARPDPESAQAEHPAYANTHAASLEPDGRSGNPGADIGVCLDAIHRFANAYNNLLAALLTDKPALSDNNNFSARNIRDGLRSGVYRPVSLPASNKPDAPHAQKISLYEIGVSSSANYKEAGRLVVSDEKLLTALTYRRLDVMILFTHDSEGLLYRLRAVVQPLAGVCENETIKRYYEQFINTCFYVFTVLTE